MQNKLIAYLIQAHNNPNHLYKLISSLNNDEVSFFVHIDKKSNIDHFKLLFTDFENVYFVENRVNVIWKGFSQVEATIKTIELALNQEISFKYFILLSGVDYPIKSNKFILDFFKNTNNNYLEFREIIKSNNYFDYFKNNQLWFKISKWHFYDTFKIHWNSKNGSFKHWIYRFYILFNILLLNLFIKNKKIDENYKYYFGSSWWCLNNESVIYIYDFYKNNKDFNKIFYFSDASDEMYFHTIILNSKYKDICINDNLRYIDWDINREGPAILDKSDFENIKKSSNLFARKFGEKSKELISLIGKNIL